jgi:hypothetical protein
MEIVRYLDAGHGPLVGIQDGPGVHELPVPSLSALLALPLAGIGDDTAKAAAGQHNRGPVLRVSAETWRAFTGALPAGAFRLRLAPGISWNA